MHVPDRLHVDLDSLDLSEARANESAAPRGPSLARLLECIRLVTERQTLAGAAITANDPDFDPNHRTRAAARAIAHEIARGIRSQPTSVTG